MAKEIEFYKGKPVFFAANSKELARAVAAYDGEAQPPHVVRWSGKVSKVRERPSKMMRRWESSCFLTPSRR